MKLRHRELAKLTQLLKGTASVQIWISLAPEPWLLMDMQGHSPGFLLLLELSEGSKSAWHAVSDNMLDCLEPLLLNCALKRFHVSMLRRNLRSSPIKL